MTKKSQSEQYRDDIVSLMRKRGTTEMSFTDALNALREAYRAPLRADFLKNALQMKSSPLALIDQGATVVLLDITRLIDPGDIDD